VTKYSDFLDNIRNWLVHPEYDDNLVDGFVRSAESNLNRQIRVKEMIEIDEQSTVLKFRWRSDAPPPVEE